MRLRGILGTVLGTGMLLLASPAVANAATGDFSYRFVDSYGITQESTLMNPPSRECINLPEVTGPNSALPADSPRNATGATAAVFSAPDCEGDYFSLRPLTGHGSERLKLRSVLFS
jgi:hypothetical protein